MNRTTLTLIALSIVAPATADEVFRTQLQAPVIFTQGGNEIPVEPEPNEPGLEVQLSPSTLPEATATRPWSFDFKTLTTLTNAGATTVDMLGWASDIAEDGYALPGDVSIAPLTGIMTGTPLAEGDYTFEVVVSHDGTEKDRETYTIRVGENALRAAQVDVHDLFSCALSTAGAVVCWGSEANAKTGTPPAGSVPTSPHVVPGLESGVTKMEIGGSYGCAIQNGGVKCWGWDAADGRLGSPAAGNAWTARPVTGLSENVTDLSVGSGHACAVQSGAAKCWGWGGTYQVGATSASHRSPLLVAFNVERVFAGNHASCLITTSGGAQCWGANNAKMLSSSSDGHLTSGPTQFFDWTSGVTDMAIGQNFVCGIRNSDLYCAGSMATQMTIGSRRIFGAINASAEGSSMCTTTTQSSGYAYCMGMNSYGNIQPGSSSTLVSPTPLTSMTNVTQIAVGSTHSCAIANGIVKCWGNNSHYQASEIPGTVNSPMSILPPP